MSLSMSLALGGNQVASSGGFTNLVSNGDFSAGSTGWTLQDGNTVISGGQAVATTAGNMLYQNVGLTAGPTYTISFTYTCTSGVNLRIATPVGPVTGGTVVLDQAIITDGAAHTYSGTFTATNVWLSIEASGSLFTGTIDNIVVHT